MTIGGSSTDPSATTGPAEQTTPTPIPGSIMQEGRQWLAPGVVVAVVLATGALQSAHIRALSSKIDQVNDRLNGRVDQLADQVNGRFDQVSSRIDRLTNQVNARFDQVYQLLLP